jgi:hypothetical protein
VQDAEIGPVSDQEDKVLEAHVTHWQEPENQGKVQRLQEQKSNNITLTNSV